MKSSEYNLNYQLPSRERKIPKKTINANPLCTTSTYKPIATSFENHSDLYQNTNQAMTTKPTMTFKAKKYSS